MLGGALVEAGSWRVIFLLDIPLAVVTVSALWISRDTALEPAPDELTGIASGINTTVSRVGQLMAVTALGVAVSVVFGTAEGSPFELGTRSAAELSHAARAFQAAMWLAAALAVAGAFVSGIGLPRRARSEEPGPAPDSA